MGDDGYTKIRLDNTPIDVQSANHLALLVYYLLLRPN